jgi:hypothetical protein
MQITLPLELESLASSLCHDHGFRLVHDEVHEPTGNRVLDFRCDKFTLRLNLDRGIWSVELLEASAPDHWYYTALIRELVHHISADHVMSLEEKVTYWQQLWPDVKAYFQPDPSDVHQKLQLLKQTVCRRQNPGWFK